MASTICAFCSNYTSRFFICQSCLTTYNRELGVGWEKQEWAIEFIRLHRQQVTAQNREDQRTVYLDDERTLPEDTHTVVVSRFEPNSSLLDDLVLSFGKQAFGSKKITQLIQAQGWVVSREAVRIRLKRFRDAALLPELAYWNRKALSASERTAAEGTRA